MKSNRLFFGFIALLVIVSLACGGSSAPTTNPTLPPVPTNAPIEQPTQEPNQAVSNELVTFADQNGLFEFDLPGDWYYENEDLGRTIYTDATAYRDTFSSPDETAFIESLVFYADNEVNNSVSQGVALDILNTYYSSTGQNNGDIRISSDQIMQDGSERFEWESKGGNYSGITFFEVRGSDKRTWLMWTLWWDNSADQAVLDVLDAAISSYRVP